MVLGLTALTLPAAGCLKYQQGRVDYGSASDHFVEIDGQQIRVLDAGKGDVVLFIHGFGSFIEAWSLVMPAFRKQGYRVVALDLPGFGKSDKINRDYSPHGLAVTVHQVMKKLGIDRAHVVAHSWGCSVALALARYRPMHVGRLVLTGAWVFDEIMRIVKATPDVWTGTRAALAAHLRAGRDGLVRCAGSSR